MNSRRMISPPPSLFTLLHPHYPHDFNTVRDRTTPAPPWCGPNDPRCWAMGPSRPPTPIRDAQATPAACYHEWVAQPPPENETGREVFTLHSPTLMPSAPGGPRQPFSQRKPQKTETMASLAPIARTSTSVFPRSRSLVPPTAVRAARSTPGPKSRAREDMRSTPSSVRAAHVSASSADAGVRSFSAFDRVSILSEALPYLQRFRGKTVVIKYGGAAMKVRTDERTDLREGDRSLFAVPLSSDPAIQRSHDPTIPRSRAMITDALLAHDDLETTRRTKA